MRDDPELAIWMEDNGEGLEERGSDGPAAAEQFDGMIVGRAALEMDGEVEVAESGGRSGLEAGAAFIEGELPGRVWDQPGGAAGAVGVVPGDLLGEQGVGGIEVTDACGAQQAHQAVLESAKAAFDFALGLRIGRDAVGNAQAEQRALELGADIVGAGVWRGAEEREAVGVVGARGAVSGDGGACATEVRPSRLVRDEATGDDFARVVVEGEDEDGFGSSRPPLMRGGIVLPKFADGAGLPAAARFWAGLGSRRGQLRQMSAAPRGDGGAGAVKIQAAREFVGEQSEIERAAVREELAGKGSGIGRPRRGVIAAAGPRIKGSGIGEPAVTQDVEPRAAHFESCASGGGITTTGVEVSEE